MRVVFDHLYERLAGNVFSVARHYWEEDLLFLTKVEGSILLPEIQEIPCRGLRRCNLVSLGGPPEPTGMHQAVMVVLG